MIILMIAWIGVIVLAVYSLAVFVIMEFAVDHSRPRLKGEKLRIKVDGFVVKNLYRGKWFNDNEEIPYNICALYRGLWWGLIVTVCTAIFVYFFIVILAVVGFALGFLLNLESAETLPFHKFERFGENDEKKWIAPWKILIPILVLVFYKHILSFLEVLPWPLLTKISLYICLAAITITAVVFIITKITKVVRKKEFWQATKEWLKSAKGKVCLEVEPVLHTKK